MRCVSSPSYATRGIPGEGLKSTDLTLEATKKYKLLMMLIITIALTRISVYYDYPTTI